MWLADVLICATLLVLAVIAWRWKSAMAPMWMLVTGGVAVLALPPTFRLVTRATAEDYLLLFIPLMLGLFIGRVLRQTITDRAM